MSRNTCTLQLQEAREKRGLSLDQIADSTKISKRFLRAIEDEEFSVLPGGIFDVSYLRQYAAAVGYDEGRLLTCYRAAMGLCPKDEGSPRRRGLLGWLTAKV